MSVGVQDPPMAKSQSESVRIDPDIMRKARIVASIRDISVTKYLAEILRPTVERDHAEAVAGEAQGLEKPSKPKR